MGVTTRNIFLACNYGYGNDGSLFSRECHKRRVMKTMLF